MLYINTLHKWYVLGSLYSKIIMQSVVRYEKISKDSGACGSIRIRYYGIRCFILGEGFYKITPSE